MRNLDALNSEDIKIDFSINAKELEKKQEKQENAP